MREKKSFNSLVYKDWLPILNVMSEHERSEVLLAIASFPDYEPNDVPLWDFFRGQLQKQYENFSEKCEKNQQIAKDREESKRKSTNVHERQPRSTTEHERARTCTNVHVKPEPESESIPESKSIKDIDSVEKEEIVHSAEPNALPFSKIVEIYNSVTDGKLPKVAKLTDKRKKAVRNWVKFYKDYTKSKTVAEFLVEVEKYFVLAVDSAFLTGENDRGWKADFDFLMNVNKSVGLLEGKYTSAQKPKEEENPFKITPIHDWYQEREDYLKAQREQEEFIKAKRAEEEKEGLHHEEAIRRYFKECNA